mmetsp:Transcript_968/g.1206  ORF Transcript_968/g.1206 Transcript_968/m.1206 type:complete len:121 (-) Transcript_968:76-438(-)
MKGKPLGAKKELKRILEFKYDKNNIDVFSPEIKPEDMKNNKYTDPSIHPDARNLPRRNRKKNAGSAQSIKLKDEGRNNRRRSRVLTTNVRPPTTNTLRGLRMLREIEETMGEDPNQIFYV